MSEKVAGKTFSTPEEAGVNPPTEAEKNRARMLFDEFQQEVDEVTEARRAKEVSPKFWDDLRGTEYEGPHGD
jgi:hypothetical protein